MAFDLGPFPESPGYDEAVALDRADPLADHRSGFFRPDPDLIYMDGNSLGRLPIATSDLVDDVVHRQWGERLIRSWNDGWWDMQIRLGDLIAPLVCAEPGEVIVSDSTSVNLYKLAWAALEARPGRVKIVTDDLNFPTDVYVLHGLAGQRGLDLEILQSDGVSGPVEAISRALDESTALLALSHTVFKSGYTYDMADLTRMAHEAGALTLWDLSHSVGVYPVTLGASGADLAVGCTYKYLNGGPGSPAFLFVRSELQDRLRNPISAWWGHEDPFSFELDFRPAEGIRKFHTGTMPILSMAPIEAGLEMIASAGMDAIREKSIALTGYLVGLWETILRDQGFGLASPEEPKWRGSHVSLSHPEAWPVARALIEIAKVIPDFRAPDNLRLGLSPLYTSFVDVHTAVHRCLQILVTGRYREFTHEVARVT
jgi:kynureninase